MFCGIGCDKRLATCYHLGIKDYGFRCSRVRDGQKPRWRLFVRPPINNLQPLSSSSEIFSYRLRFCARFVGSLVLAFLRTIPSSAHVTLSWISLPNSINSPFMATFLPYRWVSRVLRISDLSVFSICRMLTSCSLYRRVGELKGNPCKIIDLNTVLLYHTASLLDRD